MLNRLYSLIAFALLAIAAPVSAADVWQQIPNTFNPATGATQPVWQVLKDQGNGTFAPLAASGSPATSITGTCSVAAASCAASLTGVAGSYTYVTGFQCTAAGATAALDVTATLAGVVTGTNNYTFVFPAGATVAATPLVVAFPVPVRSSALAGTITLTLPSGGTGNTNSTCSIQGYTQ